MKKAISLLLILAVALSMSAVAFAATDYPPVAQFSSDDIYIIPETNPGAYNNNAGTYDNNAGTYNNNNMGTYDVNVTDVPGSTPGTTVRQFTIPVNDLFLVDNNKTIVGYETELKPDETYKFDVYYAYQAITNQTQASAISMARKLTAADIGNKGTVKLRTVKGSSHIQSAKIRTVGSGTTKSFRLEIETRANYGTKMNDVEYNLYVVDSETTLPVNETTQTFKVGFNEISDSDTDIGEGGTITISNDAPVILKEQFTDIAKSANYKNVIFESDDGNWIFTGKVSGMKDTNFSFNYDPDTDLLNKYPEHEFKFLNFPAGVNFPTTGEMRIDVSDVSDDFKTMYAYLYRNGQLTEINATYDSGADELVFRTNYLGEFVITNRPITDTSIIDEEPDEDELPPQVEYPNNTNPNTGATGSMNVMVTLGMLSLASAAAIGRKRK